MIIYIAGKVSGCKIHECTMKFGEAQKRIEAKGHVAINPLAEVNDWKMPWKEAMKICIASMMKCDAVYFMPCYKDSKGAMLEHHIARAIPIPCFFSIDHLWDFNHI
jgi:hypothetical protein